MRQEFLPFSPPTLGEEEIAEVVATLRSPWISTGPKTAAFQEEFAAYLGAPGALALNSCTAGLHTALVTLGVGPGDEVITTPMTFAASANVIEHVGATPILADVEPDTLNLDPRAVEAVLSKRTRAVLPVHFAGHPADLDPIMELAQSRGAAVIEDAAHALPARYRGRLVGSGENPTAFSFYATKNLTTGEGGMLTGTPEFLERARVVSLHGMNRAAWKRYGQGGNWFYEVTLPGFKYNMSDIQASLGLWQLRKLDSLQTRRREVVEAYRDAFAGEEALELPVERAEVEHAWHLYVVRLRLDQLTIDRARFIQELDARRIGTSVHFIPIHVHPYYRDKYGFRPHCFPVAFGAYERTVSLPLNPTLTPQDVEDVADAVLDVVRTFRR
jgi:dTDP-4-amino-4,6-dideoxygalactose transaminase